MVDDDTYSLADLVEVTGAKRRSVQLWAERGVIHALAGTESAGTGVHRRFSRDEAIIACIIHAFAVRQVSIGELQAVSGSCRTILKVRRELIDAAIGGSGDTMLSFESWFVKGKLHHQATAGRGGEIFAPNRKEPGHMCMAIRLETYLAQLK